MPDVVSLSGPTYLTTRKFSMVGSYTENLENPLKIGGWAFARLWALARDNTVCTFAGEGGLGMGIPNLWYVHLVCTFATEGGGEWGWRSGKVGE